MRRSLVLFVSAAMLLSACSTPEPVAAQKIKPPTPAVGPGADCAEVDPDDVQFCVPWSAPEPHSFAEVLPINGDEAGTGKGAQWGPYYWCAAMKDDVVKEVLGTEDFAKLVMNKYECRIAARGSKKSGVSHYISIHVAPYEPGNASYDWFSEPNPLGDVIEVNGRKAVRTRVTKFTVADQAQYTVEIPRHGSVWSVDVRRDHVGSNTPFTADYEKADQNARLVIDALRAYDEA